MNTCKGRFYERHVRTYQSILTFQIFMEDILQAIEHSLVIFDFSVLGRVGLLLATLKVRVHFTCVGRVLLIMCHLQTRKASRERGKRNVERVSGSSFSKRSPRQPPTHWFPAWCLTVQPRDNIQQSPSSFLSPGHEKRDTFGGEEGGFSWHVRCLSTSQVYWMRSSNTKRAGRASCSLVFVSWG